MKSLKAVVQHLVTVSLVFGLGAAHAAVNFAENPGNDFLLGSFLQSEFDSHPFDVTGPAATYTATITDELVPVATRFLGLYIFDPQGMRVPGQAETGTEATPPGTSAWFSFNAAAGHNYVAYVLARAGDFQGIQPGLWKIQITEHQIPIPEPGVWLMMAGGIVLLGWLRMHKSGNLG